MDMPYNTRIHSFSNDVLEDFDAVKIAQLIQNKDISAKEAVQASITRANAVNPRLNAIQSEQFEQALKASTHTSEGIFSGIPFFMKDNTDLAGFTTHHGSAAIHNAPVQKNPPLSQQLADQGFIFLGKSTLPEFGLNATTEYKNGTATKNPWHTEFSCGASSGGSAALVAAGVVPIAHANDGGGSIRIPAACCGLVGLKPTRGRTLDSEAASKLPINIISEGALTRSVRDTAHFMAGMEQSFYNVRLPKIGLIEHAAKRRLRIGVVQQSITGSVDQDTAIALEQTAQQLAKLGHHIEYYQLPFAKNFVDDFSHYWGFLSFLLQSFGKQLFGANFQPNELDNLTIGLSKLYKSNFYKTPIFLHRLKKIQHQYQQVFTQFDVLLSPVLAHTTPRLGYISPQLPFDELFARIQNYVTFTPIQNIAGAPAISLPLAATKEYGLPIGMQFSANLGDERTLLELAFELEEAHPWKKINAEALN
ncbi:amidase [Acinetobacter sp. ANC 3813]|uniref:amidase n=1 Tax=Acinetobacter sp. ANC 3813 TaxID=1977873 RepID=UPI000A3460E3|nr:amidase [Acinetobacter sp. ANC 3813]OTG91398.1 amidase [Acinetobacter sp. ANC 3813]